MFEVTVYSHHANLGAGRVAAAALLYCEATQTLRALGRRLAPEEEPAAPVFGVAFGIGALKGRGRVTVVSGSHHFSEAAAKPSRRRPEHRPAWVEIARGLASRGHQLAEPAWNTDNLVVQACGATALAMADGQDARAALSDLELHAQTLLKLEALLAGGPPLPWLVDLSQAARLPPDATAPEEFDGDPTARVTSELAAPEQIALVRRTARRAGVDAEFECEGVLRCPLNVLNGTAAAWLAAHLNEIAKGARARWTTGSRSRRAAFVPGRAQTQAAA